MRAEILALLSDLKTYVDHGDSGRTVLRRFCPECGSPVITDAAAYPGILIIKAGTLDDPGQVTPGRQIFCASKHPWMPVLGGIAAFDAGHRHPRGRLLPVRNPRQPTQRAANRLGHRRMHNLTPADIEPVA